MTDTLVHLSHPQSLFIGGAWLQPADGARLDLTSPATEDVFGQVGLAGSKDVDLAVAAARHAFDHGPWPHMSGPERAEVLRRIAAAMVPRAEDFAWAWTMQMGMPLARAQASAAGAKGYFEYYAELAEQGFEELRQPAMGGHCIVVREPVGVVAAVVPWNAPLSSALLKVAPALAAGCTVILKPSPETPLEALVLAECIAAAGVPEGVFSVLVADREVSDYLIRQDGVDKVSFTGSTAAGLHIASVCGSRMARLTTELGGKSAAIVLDDADVATVVAGIMPNLVGMCGQQCAAFSRIVVPRSRKDEITGALAAAMQAVRVGDPFDGETQMGPLVSRRQHERVFGYFGTGQTEGARIVTGGKRPGHLPKGFYVEPTLFDNADNSMAIAREEIFGPVGTVLTYDTLEEAISIANDTHFGLSGGVFTQDKERAYAVARRIRTGNIAQNGRVIDFTIPYGGFKQSGLGREGGIEGLHGFTEIKALFMPELPAHLAG